ncbi:MAG: helix-turn-helix domain-containing protein [Oscillospiraceae bacterium]|nr:helix-turn-helix domain-containing protein [Oscillospiraceae bacterium]
MEDTVKQYEKRGEASRKKIARRHASTSSEAKEYGKYHGTYQFENLLLSYIRDGEVEKLRTFLEETAQHMEFNVGTLADDLLRQTKNQVIGFTAMVGKVAGIGGGMEVEDAYRLIDLYTQEVEKCETVDMVWLLQFNMVLDFTERVRQAKLPEDLSREVFSALQYIADHAHESIGIDDVASAVNLSRSSLTKRFRKETGKSITEHITETKIRDAKRLLRYSDRTYGEIANTLAFSSQAYFQMVFKKVTGMTPGEYRRKQR